METEEKEYWDWYRNESLSSKSQSCKCSNKGAKTYFPGEICNNCGELKHHNQ